MSERYTLSDQARDDLLDVWSYTFEFHESDRVADAKVDELYAAFELITRNPNIGTTRHNLVAGQRAFPKNRYVIIYEIVDDTVEISRVCDGNPRLSRNR